MCARIFLVLGLWLVPPCQSTAVGNIQSGSIEGLIQRAGDTDMDQERVRILQELHTLADPNSRLKQDASQLISQIEQWMNHARLDYFGRSISRSRDWDFGIPAHSAVHPLTLLYRARMLVWYALESGSVWNNPQQRRAFLGQARELFTQYSRRFPRNRIVRMYLGEPIEPTRPYPEHARAPAWAQSQREGLERLSSIIEWWIDQRMQADGQYGGGWGDDCEMWRWWTPILIGFKDAKINQAQQRFSEAIMSQPHMRSGYTTRMSDVEHTAEDSADAITPMMNLDPDNPAWRTRALQAATFMRTKWTGRNQRGHLQFKSTYFTAERVDADPQRACDTVYHARAIQPALLYWQRTGLPELTDLVADWMNTWLDATARAERGKPAGLMPSAIHWPEGMVGGMGKDWWDPRNHGEHTLYLWPSAMRMMMNTLLLTHHMTGQDRYLEPMRSMGRIRLAYLRQPAPQSLQPGTEAWCAARMEFIDPIAAKYRFLTQKTEFDELIAQSMSPYVRLRLHGQDMELIRALTRNAKALRLNWPGYTSEVRYTDRVLRFPRLFAKGGILAERSVDVPSPDPGLLYSSVTGDPGAGLYFPMNAVRWLTPARDIAALVTESGQNKFKAQLFHFGRSARKMGAEFYLLSPGEYALTLETGVKKLQANDLTVTEPRTRVFFELPPEQLCKLRIHKR
jgi:hypothetical protein